MQAKYPGSGKTYTCQYMKELGYNVLTVCPTNVLVLDFVMKNKPADLVDDDIDLASDYECDESNESEDAGHHSVTLNNFLVLVLTMIKKITSLGNLTINNTM
jgi:broad-specificity NMP kinase